METRGKYDCFLTVVIMEAIGRGFEILDELAALVFDASEV